jgi:hypothetical protein
LLEAVDLVRAVSQVVRGRMQYQFVCAEIHNKPTKLLQLETMAAQVVVAMVHTVSARGLAME